MHSHSHDHAGHDHQHNGCSHSNMEMEENAQQEEQKHYHEVKSSFANYAKDMRTSNSQIFGDQKIMKYFELVRERKRERFEKAINTNQQFLDLILQSIEAHNTEKFVPDEITMCQNLSKIRTTVKQFYREWCSESPELKDYFYLVQIAKKYLKKKSSVLVPGCGLGRLALELIEAGFDSQGNEVTYFMLFGSNFILNCVDEIEQFEIYPFIHTLSSHESEDDMFRSVRVPDKLALNVVTEDSDFSMASGEFTEIYSKYPAKFDSVVTCFFIDTANNIFQYIDTIFDTLKPGGIWINYGPLLYHFKDMLDQVSIELSWEQVESYICVKGFIKLEEDERQTTYCHDPNSSYTHIYKALMSVWKKPMDKEE